MKLQKIASFNVYAIFTGIGTVGEILVFMISHGKSKDFIYSICIETKSN
ncbi:multidrug transporter EmrE-like cation transporter [Clostridium saccharoperbutylacetonicum]|nr:hypothetical protein [Clostridium saccharoperbutylacetonicum]NSB43125.1 multidrug transporter EmrE-like cation transporter [Clostridium saccharoperbutylacetonicum]